YHSEMFIYGLESIFMEVLINAGKNANNSRIEVTVSTESVTIKNYGTCIQVVQNEAGTWLPETIFGHLRPYNPIGVKITNIFSKTFSIESADSQRGLLYKQIWENNMNTCHNSEITPYNGDDYTQVSYSPD